MKHYGRGNDAVLKYLSRYVFRTAISNARILSMDDTHVVFRCKEGRTQKWRNIRLPGVEFLRRFLQHVLPRGFHKIRYGGLWHHSKRELSSRAWLLLMLEKPTDAASPAKIADLLEALREVAEQGQSQRLGQQVHRADEDHQADVPRCPHCGGTHTRFIALCPRFGVP